MFNAESTAPAPSPYGIAHIHIATKFDEKENPNKATAVVATETVVTSPVPNQRSLFKLETIVHPAIIILTIPAYERGTFNSGPIIGHADPSNASGNPRLIKAM